MRSSLPRDLATLARLPNLPTVWSTVATAHLLTLALAREAVAGTKVPLDFSPATLAWLLVSATLLYLCGTFLNDASDADFDRQHRPERPVPGKRMDRATVLNLGLIAGALGIAAAVPAGKFAAPAAAALACFILLYTWLHKRAAAALVWMGLCRAGLVPLAAAGVIRWTGPGFDRPLAWLAAYMVLLFCYTCGVSLAARAESTGGAGRFTSVASILLLGLPFLAPTFLVLWLILHDPEFRGWQPGAIAGACGALGLGWLWFASSARAISPTLFVSRALPGLALVDAVMLVLTACGLAEPALFAIPLAAFALALGLQRLVPAT